MNPVKPFLDQEGVLILDGGLATELESRGADLSDDLWSAGVLLSSPELIEQVHLDYFRAGARVATTATYQASFQGFGRRGLGPERARQLMLEAVELAIAARRHYLEEAPAGTPAPLVAASAGCYGAYLADGSEFRGDYELSLDELMDFHRPRLRVLASSRADLIAFETVPQPREAEALMRLLAEFPGRRAWLSFSCRDGRSVSSGDPLRRCVALADSSPQIVAVGVNCTAPRFIESLLKEARGATRKPLVAYPNSGESWDADRRCWRPGGEKEGFAEAAAGWRRAGARLIGGCCRTTPEDIRRLRDALLN